MSKIILTGAACTALIGLTGCSSLTQELISDISSSIREESNSTIVSTEDVENDGILTFEGEIAEALEEEIMSQMPDDFETDFDLDLDSETTEAGTVLFIRDDFTMDIPKSWSFINLSGIQGYYLDEYGTNMNLISESVSRWGEIEDYLEASQLSIETYMNVVGDIAIEELQINDYTFYVFRYKHTYEGYTFETFQPTLIENGMSYILTFQGQEGALVQHQADIMSVLESVHILEY